VVQAAEEDCDDGVNIGRPCPSGCHILIVESGRQPSINQ
jgi:hypothetical protein